MSNVLVLWYFSSEILFSSMQFQSQLNSFNSFQLSFSSSWLKYHTTLVIGGETIRSPSQETLIDSLWSQTITRVPQIRARNGSAQRMDDVTSRRRTALGDRKRFQRTAGIASLLSTIVIAPDWCIIVSLSNQRWLCSFVLAEFVKMMISKWCWHLREIETSDLGKLGNAFSDSIVAGWARDIIVVIIIVVLFRCLTESQCYATVAAPSVFWHLTSNTATGSASTHFLAIVCFYY